MERAWAVARNDGWEIRNRVLGATIGSAKDGSLMVTGLQDLRSGRAWNLTGGEPAVLPRVKLFPGSAGGELVFRVAEHEIRGGADGRVELEIRLEDSRRSAFLTLILRCFPGLAVLEMEATLENRGSTSLPLVRQISPLALITAGSGLRVHAPAPEGRHGFVPVETTAGTSAEHEWLALEDSTTDECLVVGGDGGAGVLTFRVRVAARPERMELEAGFSFRAAREGRPVSAFEVESGERARTPLVFLALAAGDPDDAANEAFRYLKTHVLPRPLPGSPYASYCIWLTDTDVEPVLHRELELARRLGFDVFYHDASWYEGSSTVPGMNDWMAGQGSYRESREKFPNGLATLSARVRDAGLGFGLWVDPGNVDSLRVERGEIPESWVAAIDGKLLRGEHPSLSPWTQLCLGNPEVVEWVKGQLERTIRAYGLAWMKWDPSGTVDHACTREDHGHHRHNGAQAAYEGKMAIWSHLLERFPGLSGFECEPSLRHSRLNAGPRTLMPGGWSNLFMVGPMVSPLVWDSLASTQTAEHEKLFGGTWYGASALDYRLRQCLMQGIAFGNINGSEAQLLSNAPPGFLEALKRNLTAFKRFRHLLFEDVYHPRPESPASWNVVEYARRDGSEAVVFLFRHPGGAAENRVRLRGLEAAATYHLTSLNERPGPGRTAKGAELMGEGVGTRLPNEWLARGDALPGPQYADQLEYGSDIILVHRTAE